MTPMNVIYNFILGMKIMVYRPEYEIRRNCNWLYIMFKLYRITLTAKIIFFTQGFSKKKKKREISTYIFLQLAAVNIPHLNTFCWISTVVDLNSVTDRIMCFFRLCLRSKMKLFRRDNFWYWSQTSLCGRT